MSITGYLQRHEEQAFVAKALATALAIVLVKNFLPGLVSFLVVIFPVVFLVVIRMHAAATGVDPMDLLREHITFLPMMRSEDERREEVKPWVTYGIIFVNVVVYYLFELNVSPDFISDNLVFLPHQPGYLNVPLSALTAVFLHGSGAHLWGNMTFLWVVGTAVERRVGARTFSWVYLLTGLIGGLSFIGVEFLSHGRAGHGLGASGAIAGIMGVFAVRCYFKSMIFPLPILGIFSLILPISLKIRLNSLVIMALFFLFDLSGGIAQITGESEAQIGHWAHLGGMIAGMLVAAYLKLGEDAVEERHLEIGIKASQADYEDEEGARSLKIALERSPDSIDGLLAMARMKARSGSAAEGRELYEKVIGLMVRERPAEVIEVFREYVGKYRAAPPDPALVSSLVELLRKAGELDLSIHCLEHLIKLPDTPPQARERGLFLLATLLELYGCDEAARWHFARFAAEYPGSILADKARERAAGEIYVPPRPKEEPRQTGEFPAAAAIPAPSTPPAPPPTRYRLVFRGDIALSSDREVTKENLSRLFGCGRERVDHLFGGKPMVLKKDLDLDAALALKRKFEQTGALCVMEQQPAAAVRPGPAAPVPASTPSPAAVSAPAAPPSPAPAQRHEFACPKCGQIQERSDSCNRCGVYFTKLARQVEREADSFRGNREARTARSTMSEAHERRWAMWCHLLAISGVVVPFGNVLGPLAVWLWKRKESEFVDFHGKVSLNYQLSLTLFVFGCAMVAAFTGFVGVVLGPLLGMLGVYTLIMVVASAVKAQRGDVAHIALSAAFIK